MKRSGPPERRTPLRRDTPAARKFQQQRARLHQQSQKRARQAPVRAAVRAEVLARDVTCRLAELVPEVRCAFYPPDRPGLEVDELRGGAFRSTEWLDADRCQALCPAHHDWKTTHKREALRRLAEGEPDE